MFPKVCPNNHIQLIKQKTVGSDFYDAVNPFMI